jgi:hypothetical protein
MSVRILRLVDVWLKEEAPRIRSDTAQAKVPAGSAKSGLYYLVRGKLVRCWGPLRYDPSVERVLRRSGLKDEVSFKGDTDATVVVSAGQEVSQACCPRVSSGGSASLLSSALAPEDLGSVSSATFACDCGRTWRVTRHAVGAARFWTTDYELLPGGSCGR